MRRINAKISGKLVKIKDMDRFKEVKTTCSGDQLRISMLEQKMESAFCRGKFMVNNCK